MWVLVYILGGPSGFFCLLYSVVARGAYSWSDLYHSDEFAGYSGCLAIWGSRF